MLRNKMGFVIMSAVMVMLACSAAVSAETWHLEKDRGWKAVSAEGQDKYLLAVVQVKRLVNTGRTEEAVKALNQLKRDFPEIAGPDLDAFIKAEVLLAEGKYAKAVRGYDKFLAEFPKSELYEAALDRQFAIATAFLAGEKKPVLKVFKIKGYAEGAKIMERISDRAGDSPIAVKAALAIADSLERRGKFDEAYYQWSHIASRWPEGQIGKETLLAMARCKHAAYRGPDYDESNLNSAKSYYENFKLRYPEDAEKFDIDKKLGQINEQRAYKQFSIGRYYQKVGNKQSANLYYQMVIDNWPGSTAAEMAEEEVSREDKKTQRK